MTRDEIKKAHYICEVQHGRCKTGPLYEIEDCLLLIQLETEHEEEVKTKLREMTLRIVEEAESALASNYAARKERIEKGHTSDDFLSVIDGKIAALRGMSDFVEQLLDDMLAELEKEGKR